MRAVMRRLALWICASLPALGQFAELATNADGSQVYFTTSFRQRRTQQTYDPKLFRLSHSGLSLLATETCDPLRMTGVCGMTELQVSADGTLLAYQSQFRAPAAVRVYFANSDAEQRSPSTSKASTRAGSGSAAMDDSSSSTTRPARPHRLNESRDSLISRRKQCSNCPGMVLR
jgi:hypothetical protein